MASTAEILLGFYGKNTDTISAVRNVVDAQNDTYLKMALDNGSYKILRYRRVPQRVKSPRILCFKNIQKINHMKIIRFLLTAVIALLAGCSSDMNPKRPYTVPFDLSKAGHIVKFDIEVLEPTVGVGLILVFYFQDETQRTYLTDAVMRPMRDPDQPNSAQTPETGQVVPIHVKVTSSQDIIFEGVRLTKAAQSLTAATPGYLNRIVWGKGLPKGKYQIQVTNIEAQPVFNGYKIDLRIPGDSKV